MAKPRPPAELRLLKNDKAHAHLDKNIETPKPSTSKAKPSPTLSERGIEIFYEMVNMIEESYPCSETDGQALTLYANNREQREYMEVFLRLHGVSYCVVDSLGNEIYKKRPEVDIHKQCKDFELAILRQFGLTPSSRSHIVIPKKPEKKKNSFADLDEVNG
ncbi:MAG: hypothetical protein A2W11_06145 [Ignavibacteria bacterium RBG_16_35_7]|nr:MAG: hypothetical protein A2W11_06145 [Ignavibacteria bacterium RBG_16_35_7]